MKHIEVLAELQKVDQSLRENTTAVESRQKRLAELESAVTSRGGQAATATENLNGLTARQNDLEQRLAALEHKMKDRRMRLTRIRNDKELGVAKREMEILKDEAATLEAELLEVMEQVDGATKTAEGLTAELEQLRADAETEAAELKETRGRVGSLIEKDQARREEIVGGVEEGLRRRYEMIFSRRDGLAVVQVRSGVCLGCHMNVPPQLFNMVQRNDDIHLCPSCQRILFWKPETEDAED